MDHLSSCYFCGTTLDETLRDYRVVPVELRDTDDATTATLCQSCHGKLERLLAPVVEAAGEDGVTLDARPAPDRRESETTADPPDLEATGAPDTDDTGTDTADHEDDESDEDPLLTDVEANLVDIEEETPPADDDRNAPDEDPPRQDEESVRVRHETADSGAADGGGTDADHGDRPDTGDVADSSEGVDTQEEADDDGDTDDGGQSNTARTTISALEYNKVMRLLQNREFPVDRREFVTVAANAYGLAEHECAEVIDLAIDRGLVDERDGQLVRPDSE